MSATKEKILEAALQLYNDKGAANVTMRIIAGDVGISSGNLAYHYKNQDYIIQALFWKMEAERDRILSGVQEVPSFENINAQILPLLELANRYRFFHIDRIHILRSYPRIAELQQAYFERSIAYIRAVIDLSESKGNLSPRLTAGQRDRLAHTVWMVMTFWLEQLIMRGIDSLKIKDLRQSVWDLVLPHLTEKGRKQFEQLYQNEYASFKFED